MPEVSDLLKWVMSGEGRLVAAAILFLIMWGIKRSPILKDHINTPRRKQAANLVLAMAPAVYLLAEGAAPVDVLSTALTVALSAHGINTYRPTKSKMKELEEDLASEYPPAPDVES